MNKNEILVDWKSAISDVDHHAQGLAAALRKCERIRAAAEAVPYADQPFPRLQRPLGRASVVDLAGIYGFDALGTWQSEARRAGWLPATREQQKALDAEDAAAAALARRHERGVKESLERARRVLVESGRLG